VRVFLCLLLLSWFVLLTNVAANEINYDDVGTSDGAGGFDEGEPEIGDIALDLMDEVHGVLSSNLLSISDQIDSFFVDDRMEEEGSNTQVIFSYYISEDIYGNFDHDYLFKARLSLPKTQDRLRLVVESTVNPNQESEGNQLGGSVSEERDSDFTTALQLIFKKTKYWQVSSKTGVRFAVPPDPFSQLRIRRLFFYDEWVTRLIETVFLSKSQGFGTSTALEVDHGLVKSLYFRSRSELTIAEEVEDVHFAQQFSIYQRITDRKMWVYSVGSDAVVEQNPYITRNYMNVRFRHNVYKKWVFYEVVPELSFERENDFDMLPIMFFKIDIVFGRV